MAFSLRPHLPSNVSSRRSTSARPCPVSNAKGRCSALSPEMQALASGLLGAKETVGVLVAAGGTALVFTSRLNRLKKSYGELKTDNDISRSAISSDVQTLRSEAKGEIQSLRSDVKGGVQSLRSDINGEVQSLRSEFKGELQGLRSELQGLRSDLRSGVHDLRSRVDRICEKLGA